jgi:hypothetical protein
MSQVDISCQQCGRVFSADTTLTQAFCVYCGARNPLPAAEAGTTGAAAAAGSGPISTPEIDAAFAAARYRLVDAKTGQKADLFVGLWTNLLFHGHNSRSRWGVKSAHKEMDQFFNRPELLAAMKLAGDQGVRLLCAQLVDSANSFLGSCRDDRRYGSRLMEMIKLSPEDVARKAAGDVCETILAYLVRLNDLTHRDLIIFSIVMAFPRAFPAYQTIFSEELEKLPIADRQLIMTTARDVADRLNL